MLKKKISLCVIIPVLQMKPRLRESLTRPKFTHTVCQTSIIWLYSVLSTLPLSLLGHCLILPILKFTTATRLGRGRFSGKLVVTVEGAATKQLEFKY